MCRSTGELAASTCAKRVKSRGEAGFLRMATAIRGMPGSEFEPRRPLQKSRPPFGWSCFLECTAGRGSKGHERSEKNVLGARFGARVRVAARQRRERASSPALKITTHSGGDFFRVLLVAHRRVSRLPPAVAARQPGHFLETASLHPPQAALRRFPRRPLQVKELRFSNNFVEKRSSSYLQSLDLSRFCR